VNSRTINAIAMVGLAAIAVWAWRAHAEAARLGEALGAANQHIAELDTSLAKAREDLNQTRAELDRAIDDAAARDAAAQSGAPAPAYAPQPPPAQPQPTSPLEMAQLQASQTQDEFGVAIDPVLELKGRH
jgi:hypothetical protein